MRSIITTTIVVIMSLAAPSLAAPQASAGAVSLDQQLLSLYPPVELSTNKLTVTHPSVPT